MKKNFLLILSILITFSCFSQMSERQRKKYKELDKIEQSDRARKWPTAPDPTYLDNSMGLELNEFFKAHGGFCGFGETNPDGDYIPTNFITRDQLDQPIKKIDIGGEFLLTYLFTEDQVDDFGNFSQVRGNRIININRQRFKVNPEEGIPSAYLSKSCSGYFNAQASASGGIKAPVASLEAAMSAETNSEKQGTIVAVKGDFTSPLNDLLSTHNSDGLAVNAFLWNHYIQFPQNDKKLFYLNDFQGVHIRRFSKKEDESKFDGNLKFGFSGFIKLDASGAGGKEVRNLFEATDWTTLITTDLVSSSAKGEFFLPINDSDEIVDFFSNHTVSGEPNSDDPIMAIGKKHKITFLIRGLPEKLSTDYWSIKDWDDEIYSSEPQVIESKFSQKENGCMIIIEGIPNDNIFSQRLTSVNPQFTLKGKPEPNLNNKSLEMIGRVSIPTSIHPTLIVEEFPRPYKTEGDGSSLDLIWNIEVKLTDTDNPLDWDITNINVKSDGFKLTKNQESEIENLNFSVSGTVKSKTDKVYSVKISTNNQFDVDYFDPDLRELEYQAQLILQLPLDGAGIAEKPFPATIRFPRIKVKPIEEVVPESTLQNPSLEVDESEN
jgi:hypothetical protein